MKIAIISPWTVLSTAVGGTERFVIDIAESLKRFGNEVDVYMLSGKKHITNGVRYFNINIIKGSEYIDEDCLIKNFGDFSNRESYIRLADTLEKLINVESYDFIQLNSQLFLKAFKNKKRIFTIHTNPFEYKMSYGENSFKTMIELMDEENNGNTFFVTPSNYYQKEYMNLTNLNIIYIPHAIDVSRVNVEVNNSKVFLKYNLNDKLKHILLPSRLEPVQKQPMLFMKSFSKLSDDIKDKFEVICTGVDKQYRKFAFDIEDFCKMNNIKLKIIRFDHMYEAYSISDIVVLPSQSESFGYSALESLALGIPTILNSIPTYMEIAKDSNNSYFFENTEESLLNQLNKVVSIDFKRLNQNNEWASRYDIDEFGKKYLEIINNKKLIMEDLNNILIYKPYDNWKSYQIIKKDDKEFLKIFDYSLEIDRNSYVPKAGLLFENVLKCNSKEKIVLDLGCGQLGILGLIALHYGAKEVVSSDIDERCIDWLRKIIKSNGINNISIMESNLFSNIDEGKKFNLILSNPPHMPMKGGKVCDNGGLDGKDYIRKIIKEAYNHLSNNGELYIMMFDFLGTNQSYNDDESVFEYAEKIGYSDAKVLFSFEKSIVKGTVTYECLDYIKEVYPKYKFDDSNPMCNLVICGLRR